MGSEEEEKKCDLNSEFKSVFEKFRKRLFEGYSPKDSEELKKRREAQFKEYYNKHVVVTGKVKGSKWYMYHDDGFIPPPDMEYHIGIKIYLRVYAKRSIKKGEELFISYGKGYWN